MLRVQPNREKAIAVQLHERGFATYYPIEAKPVSYAVRTWFGISHRKRIAAFPVFPGYLFLRFGFAADACRRHFLEIIPGIHGFLTVDNAARSLREADMLLIEKIEDELRLRAEIRSKRKRFRPGQRVRIEIGALTNLIATVAQIERMDGEDRVSVLINMLGRATEASLPVDHVTAL